MPHETLIAAPGPAERTVRTADGRVLEVPVGWVLVPPGDPGLTRRVKAAGPTWTMQEKRGRKLFSRGVWAEAACVRRIEADLAAERATPAYARKLAAAGQRREREQAAYVESFEESVVVFLSFAPPHATLARHLAKVSLRTLRRSAAAPWRARSAFRSNVAPRRQSSLGCVTKQPLMSR
jgi:hypothetical protein